MKVRWFCIFFGLLFTCLPSDGAAQSPLAPKSKPNADHPTVHTGLLSLVPEKYLVRTESPLIGFRLRNATKRPMVINGTQQGADAIEISNPLYHWEFQFSEADSEWKSGPVIIGSFVAGKDNREIKPGETAIVWVPTGLWYRTQKPPPLKLRVHLFVTDSQGDHHEFVSEAITMEEVISRSL